MRRCVTLHGQWIYPQSAVARLVELARAGLLDLDRRELERFPLSAANEAVRQVR